MPKLIDPKVEHTIKTLSEHKFTSNQIKNILNKDNINVRNTTIYNVTKNNGIRRKALAENREIPKIGHKRSAHKRKHR
jgi:hypothetical protein